MRLFVPMTLDEFERLSALAQAERRRPQDQAAVILARAIAPEHPQVDGGQIGRDSEQSEERRATEPASIA